VASLLVHRVGLWTRGILTTDSCCPHFSQKLWANTTIGGFKFHFTPKFPKYYVDIVDPQR